MLELETAYAVVEYGMRRYNRRESHCSLILNSRYSNILENNNLLAALARSGKIYTEKDKNRFQVSGRKALRLFSGDVQEQRPSDFDAEDLRMSKKSRTFAGR